MCKLLKDDEIRSYSAREELQSYLDFRKNHDRWLDSEISSMKIIPGEADAKCFKQKYGCLLPEENIRECHETGTNMFLKLHICVNGASKKGVIPVRNTAINSILDRARISGFSLTNDEEGTGVAVLPDEVKARIITECLGLYSARAKVLYRDEEISAVHSGQYAVLTESDIIEALEGELTEDFPDMTFEQASVSHSFFGASYNLNCTEIEEDIQMMLSEIGENPESVKAGIRLFTSDIGTAAVHILSYIETDGHILTFGRPVTVKHMGKKTAGDIRREVKKLYSMFKENTETLKLLSETKISHPAGCIRSIAKEMHLPKKISCEVADEVDAQFSGEKSAYEIYWYLNEIAQRCESEDNVLRNMNIRETVAECLKLDFRKFDREFEWVRKEKNDTE